MLKIHTGNNIKKVIINVYFTLRIRQNFNSDTQTHRKAKNYTKTYADKKMRFKTTRGEQKAMKSICLLLVC